MPEWDENSPRLQANLLAVLTAIRTHAVSRETPSVADAKNWHRMVMKDLTVPDPLYVGHFCGERGLEGIEVQVGSLWGVRSHEVRGHS
ncbi:MAG TPA: hypothetical protein VK968_00895, partial [Roseimicrobium sp.]|nr:hypothetical protein [Roseimicrobium sp.]